MIWIVSPFVKKALTVITWETGQLKCYAIVWSCIYWYSQRQLQLFHEKFNRTRATRSLYLLKAEYQYLGMSKDKFPVIALVFQRLWNFSLSPSLRYISPTLGKFHWIRSTKFLSITNINHLLSFIIIVSSLLEFSTNFLLIFLGIKPRLIVDRKSNLPMSRTRDHEI